MLRLAIKFQTPVHHGSGFGIAGIIDRAVLRDYSGMPYLAGSAIKGKFRSAAARIVRAGDARVCESPSWCDSKPGCDYCEIFGSPRRQGRAIFPDAYPAPDERALLREAIESSPSVILATPAADVRASTAISRKTNTVVKGHLFSTETISDAIRFEAEVGGALTAAQVALLQDAALILTDFGSGSARGLGLCIYSLEASA